MNQISRFVLASFVLAPLTVLAVLPAFAQNATVVKVKPVAQTESGRMIVRANGSTYIQLEPSEYNALTAQEMYEKYRAKIRAGLTEGNPNPAVEVSSQRAGLYRNPDTQPPIKGFVGLSLTTGQFVDGKQYVPTREARLREPGIRSYVLTEGGKTMDVALQPGCRNPDGYPDVQGLNRGRTGCYAMLKVFRKISIK